MTPSKLSDKAFSILAFGAYHALASGDPVLEVVLDDGAGHHASPDGVAELTQAGLLEVDGKRGRFTEAGRDKVGAVVEAIRGS